MVWIILQRHPAQEGRMGIWVGMFIVGQRFTVVRNEREGDGVIAQ